MCRDVPHVHNYLQSCLLIGDSGAETKTETG